MAESGQWKESISLEETNKIRISLGLKPIADPATTAGSEAQLDGDALAEDNYSKRREAEQKEKDAQALKDRLDRVRNQKERQRKLMGRGLGDADDEEARVKREEGAPDGEDNRAWIKRQKKRAKELAAKRAREEAEADRLAQEEERGRATKYGEEDLAGLKVAHGAEAFEEGEDVVLTLKDSRVLDDEDDELHNVNLSENAKTKHALDQKKKGLQTYTGYDDDEFDAGPGSSRGVLNKYDEGFDAQKDEGFRLGGSIPSTKGKGRVADGPAGDDGAEREKIKLSMDYTKTFNTDYLQEGEPGFKKPKKKKKRAMRTTTMAEEEANGTGQDMEVDGAPSTPRQIERASLDETNLIDDDDLQAALARQRRDAAKQRIKEMKARAAAAPAPPAAAEQGDNVVKKEEEDGDSLVTLSRAAGPTEEEDDSGDVLVLDDTSEFVRNISLAATAAQERAQREADRQQRIKREESEAAAAAAAAGAASTLPRVKAEEVDVPLSELTAPASGWGPPREDGEEDEPMADADEHDDAANGIAATGGEDVKPAVKGEDEDDDSLVTTGREQLVSRGLASTLSLLRHQGLVKPRTPEEIAREKEFKEREAWLAAQRRRDEERERERIESRKAGDKKDQQQREYENRMREQREAQASLQAFANYKPVVNLSYHDEFGRDLTPKEAWKQLNYDFHGHGSGSKKTDKRLKKIENERKQAAMAAGDTPLSTAAAFAARAEKTGTATMVLGVGNNNSAPVQPDTLSGISKLEKSARGKGKTAATPGTVGRNGSHGGPASVISDIPMRPLPLPGSSATRGASGTPEPGTTRRGFAPVRSFSPAAGGEDATEGGTPGPTGGAKLSIAVKRKAADEGEGSPAGKRRA